MSFVGVGVAATAEVASGIDKRLFCGLGKSPLERWYRCLSEICLVVVAAPVVVVGAVVVECCGCRKSPACAADAATG